MEARREAALTQARAEHPDAERVDIHAFYAGDFYAEVWAPNQGHGAVVPVVMDDASV